MPLQHGSRGPQQATPSGPLQARSRTRQQRPLSGSAQGAPSAQHWSPHCSWPVRQPSQTMFGRVAPGGCETPQVWPGKQHWTSSSLLQQTHPDGQQARMHPTPRGIEQSSSPAGQAGQLWLALPRSRATEARADGVDVSAGKEAATKAPPASLSARARVIGCAARRAKLSSRSLMA